MNATPSPFNIKTLDISSLPCVSLENRAYLPDAPGVYFVQDDRGVLFYIGKSTSLQRRWKAHEKLGIFERIQRQGIRVAIYHVVTSDQDRIESEAIQRFNPMVNWQVKNKGSKRVRREAESVDLFPRPDAAQGQLTEAIKKIVESRDYITLDQILGAPEVRSVIRERGRMAEMKVALALKSSGWTRKQRRIGGRRQWGYVKVASCA